MGSFPKPQTLLGLISRIADDQASAVVLLVLRAEGSCSAPAGTLAVLEASGRLHGTVGGGAVEASAIELARQVLEDGTPRRFRFALEGTDPAAPVPVCGGRMELLVWAPREQNRKAMREALDSLAAGRGGILEVRLEQSAVELAPGQAAPERGPAGRPEFLPCARVELDWRVAGSPAAGEAGAGETSAENAPGLAVETFAFPLRPQPRLIIAGGGHVGQALAHCAAFAGFAIEVVEDRADFARLERFPEGTRVHLGPIASELRRMRLGPGDFVALVTRNHLEDAAALEAVLGRGAAYVGMIGSRRKVALLRQRLLEASRIKPEELNRLHAPIGLAIGAVTPSEIAVSIVAELIAVRHGVPDAPTHGRRP